MLRWNIVLSMVIAVVVLGSLGATFAFRQKADDDTPPKKAPPKADRLTPEKVKAEEAAIRKAENEFTATYNKGDLDALMALWIEDAELVGESGKVHRGKEQVRVLLKKSLASNKGMTQKAHVESLCFVRPDVAIEVGEVTLNKKDGSSTIGRFETVWVKIDDRWYIKRIRDLPNASAADEPLAASKLKPLAWLVGEWVDKDGKGDVTVSCKWGPGMTFLLQEFRVKQEGGKELTVTQIIGYDAANDWVRSWVFDSAGGFADCFWERRGNAWVTDCNGTFPDGRQTTSTNQWKFTNDDSFSWSSRDRVVDEQPLPDIEATFIRKKGS
jgi:uncharacterized protein (TIGR02246 family)